MTPPGQPSRITDTVAAVARRITPRIRQAAYVTVSRRTLAGQLLNGRPPDEQSAAPHADYLSLRPKARTSVELSDLAARVNWYLPDTRVPIAVDCLSGTEIAPEHAPWMDPALVRDPGWLHGSPSGRAHEVFHSVGLREAMRVMYRGRATMIACPNFYPVSDLGWMWLRWHFAAMPSESSSAAMERLFSLGGRDNSAFVLATGPSARLVEPDAITATIRIICNSAVRDVDLLRALRPNVICFGDPVFHYGPSRYSAAFRRDLLRAVKETDAVLVTIEPWAGLLLAHNPELSDRLVILRVRRGRPTWTWPTRQRMVVRMTGNILTTAMLPIAFALSDHVEVAGCDGRQPSESYFWHHNKRAQYSDELMQTAFQSHPAFFRDRDYGDYYNTHCDELESLLSTAEAAGKRVRAVTPSFIPALGRRGARAPS